MSGPASGPLAIFALSSGRPPAAIAIIRISGAGAHTAASALCGELPAPRHAAVRSLRDPETRMLLDEALVLRFDGPHSATGEDLVEFHCHGGRAVVQAVLGALGSLDGLREAEPGEFTRRAFENGRIDLTEAEGLADLLEAETESQRRAALALAEGGLKRQIEEWQQRLLALSAEAELAIDYVGEEDADHALSFAPRARALQGELQEWLDRPRIEPLRDGVRVVIAGPPNAGKSSLLNALVGHERAIVSAQAGTTRDQIDVPIAIGGVPILLTDTAGLRSSDDDIEGQGISRAEQLLESADLVLWLGTEDSRPIHARSIQVFPKADFGVTAGEGMNVSSKTGQGLAELMLAIGDQAKALLPTEGAIAINARQAVSLEVACNALSVAQHADPVVAAEGLRQARAAFDRLTGCAGVENLLDTLFGRFCLGK